MSLVVVLPIKIYTERKKKKCRTVKRGIRKIKKTGKQGRKRGRGPKKEGRCHLCQFSIARSSKKKAELMERKKGALLCALQYAPSIIPAYL